MQRSDIWAVVPIKRLDHAKQRLALAYDGAFRCGLALAMAEDVLSCLSRVEELAGIVVVTSDDRAAALAASYKARVLHTEADEGYAAAATDAAKLLASGGAAGILVVPADVPLIRPEEIANLINGQMPAPSFSIVPSHDGSGSNAFLCMPPQAIEPAFGESSFSIHCARSREAGIEPRIVISPGLSLDIDHPRDLERFARRGSHTCTQRFLRMTTPDASCDMPLKIGQP